MPRKKRSSSPFELMDDDFDDTSSQSSRNGNPPIQRNAANARERARMRVLSSAFGRLKTKLPNIPADTKLSKLDTLRLATMYIKQLKSVVEGGGGGTVSRTTNSENMEISLNNENNSTNCYLDFNMGVQSMNWPFGFHHLSHSPLIRPTSSTSLINNTSNNNWCTHDSNNSEEQMEHVLYETENYKDHHHHQQQQQPSSFTTHTVLTNQQNNHWFSETPSPELDATSSIGLTYENSHPQHHPVQHHHQQQLHVSSQRYRHQHQHHHHHNLSHLQPASSTHSPTFQLQHNFHHHYTTPQNQPTASHHAHQNGFVNSSNFQSTPIR